MVYPERRPAGFAGTVLLVLVAGSGARAVPQAAQVGRFDMLEISFTTPNTYGNPFVDVNFTAQVTEPDGATFAARGFHDGGNTWKLRLMPRKLGTHSYQTSSNDAQLSGRTGSFTCVGSSRKGPVQQSAFNPHLAAYSDGTAYVPNGETAFFLLSDDWSQASRLQFIESMASVSVNKIILCMVNADTNIVHPWTGSGFSVNHSRFNLTRLRAWEEVFQRMKDRGIVAYLWFYSDDSQVILPGEDSAEEDLYFRYLIARFAAFENVVWNLCLEVSESRSGTWIWSRSAFVKAEDPYDHLIAVHDGLNNLWPGVPDLDVYSSQSIPPNIISTAAEASGIVLDNQAASRNAGRPILFWAEEWFYDPPSSLYDAVREVMWGVTLQGGGFTMMCNNFWGQVGQINWWNDLGKAQAQLMARVQAYHRMVVRNDLVVGGGSGKFAMARPGAEYIVLSMGGSAIDLDLSGAGGSFSAEWWNLDAGTAAPAGTVQGGARRTLNPPFTPTVLYLNSGGGGPDTDPPVVSITNPATNGQTVSGTLAVGGTASDASGVARVEYQIDSTAGAWTLASGTNSWSFSIDTTSLSNGSHSIHVRARDGASPANTSAPVTRTVNVSNGGTGTFTLAAAPATVSPGGSLTVSWTAPAGQTSPTDWVGLYAAGASNTQYLWWEYTGGSTSGSLGLAAPTTPGTYEFRYLLNDGYTSVATSNAVTVSNGGGSYTVSADPDSVAAGESLTVSWTAPAGQTAPRDWVGLYAAGTANTEYLWWQYTGGATGGSLGLAAPTTPGTYEFRYLLNDGFTSVAVSNAVTVTGSGAHTLMASPGEVAPGGGMTVSWQAPAGSSTLDWIGLYAEGAAATSFLWWRYTGGAPSGSFVVEAPSSPGTYEFRYFLDDGYTSVATSNAVTVSATAVLAGAPGGQPPVASEGGTPGSRGGGGGGDGSGCGATGLEGIALALLARLGRRAGGRRAISGDRLFSRGRG